MKLPIADFVWKGDLSKSLASVMDDHERWSILDGRITHDTGLWIVYRKGVARQSSGRIEMSLEGMVPFQIAMEQDHLKSYWNLENALSRAEAQDTFDKVSVLLKLCE